MLPAGRILIWTVPFPALFTSVTHSAKVVPIPLLLGRKLSACNVTSCATDAPDKTQRADAAANAVMDTLDIPRPPSGFVILALTLSLTWHGRRKFIIRSSACPRGTAPNSHP